MSSVTTGKIAWFDFPTADETKAMDFYKNVLGWGFEPMGPGYWMIKVGQEAIGGLSKQDCAVTTPGSFVAYFSVSSVKEGKALAESNGAKLVGPTVAITDGEDGYFQHFIDLDGNALALWSAKP